MAKTPQWDCPRASVNPWHRLPQERALQRSKRVLVGFGIAALEMEAIKELCAFPGLSQDPSVVGLLRAEEQQVLHSTALTETP